MRQNDITFVLTGAAHARTARSPSTSSATATASTTSRSRSTTRRSALARDDDARARAPPSSPTELDGGEDGVLRRSAVHTYGEVVHSFVDRRDYHGVFAPGLPQGQEAGRPRRAGCSLLEVDHCVGNVELGDMNKFVDFYRDVVRLRPAHPLRRQGHPHRVLGADVEGHDQRQRPDQVPDQRAGDRQEEEPDPGVPRLLPRRRHPAHRAADRGHRRRRSGSCARTASSSSACRTRTTSTLADRVGDVGVPIDDARGARHRGRPRRGGLPPPDLHPARSRTARRSSSRSSSATARAASASATSRRCSRRSRASRRSAGTSDGRLPRRGAPGLGQGLGEAPGPSAKWRLSTIGIASARNASKSDEYSEPMAIPMGRPSGVSSRMRRFRASV